MSIEQNLTTLISPPRLRFSNYNPVSRETMNSFSEFKKCLVAFDRLHIGFSLFKNIKNSSKSKVCIIYNHSHGSCREEGLQLLEVCSMYDLSLCTYDSRGCGESDQAFITFGKNESIDLLYLMFYCAIIDGFTDFILWGRSIGSCTIIQLLAKLKAQEIDIQQSSIDFDTMKWRDEVESINIRDELLNFQDQNNLININDFEFRCIGAVFDSALKSISSSIENFISKKIISFEFITRLASGWTQKWIKDKTQVDIYKSQNIDLAKKLSTTAVFMCSKSDEMVEFTDAMELYNSYGANTGKLTFKNVIQTNHTHKERRDVNYLRDSIEMILKFGKNDRGNYTFFMKGIQFNSGFSPYPVKKTVESTKNTKYIEKELNLMRQNTSEQELNVKKTQPVFINQNQKMDKEKNELRRNTDFEMKNVQIEDRYNMMRKGTSQNQNMYKKYEANGNDNDGIDSFFDPNVKNVYNFKQGSEQKNYSMTQRSLYELEKSQSKNLPIHQNKYNLNETDSTSGSKHNHSNSSAPNPNEVQTVDRKLSRTNFQSVYQQPNVNGSPEEGLKQSHNPVVLDKKSELLSQINGTLHQKPKIVESRKPTAQSVNKLNHSLSNGFSNIDAMKMRMEHEKYTLGYTPQENNSAFFQPMPLKEPQKIYPIHMRMNWLFTGAQEQGLRK